MAKEEGPLGNYLHEIAEGHPDSTGVFTIDWAKARHRYESESRKEPWRYFRFLTQFALSTRPDRLDIDYDAHHLTFRWTPSQPGDRNELEALLRGFESGHFSATSWSLDYLRRALVLLAGRNDLALTYQEAGVGCLELSPSHMRMSPARGAETWIRLELLPGIGRPEKLAFWEVDLIHPVISSHWPEIKHLKNHLVFCPTAVFLNGHRFSSDERKLSYTLFSYTEPAPKGAPTLGLKSEISGKISSKVVNASGEPIQENTYGRGYQTLFLSGEMVGPSKVGAATYSQNIVLIQDGMVVHQCRSSVFGMMVYHAVQGLRLDVDGLEAVESPERTATLSHLKQQALKMEELSKLEIAKIPAPKFGNEPLEKWKELQKARPKWWSGTG